MLASPFLMLPSSEESDSQELNRLSFYSLQHRRSYNLDLFQDIRGLKCVGSSHGWLAFLNVESGNLFLLHPVSRTRIYLPPNHTFPRFQSNFLPYSPEILKVALSVNPTSQSCTVGVLYGSRVLDKTKLAFCRIGDEKWSDLDGDMEVYYDLVCRDGTNTAFAVGPGPSVESWDLNEAIPKKMMTIEDSHTRAMKLADKAYPSDLYTSQWYLALSERHVFLVMRYVGEFVRHDGEVVHEGATLTDYAAEPLVCPYRTVDFRVYRLNAGRERWIGVETLDGSAMFLGGNESVMVSAVENPELERDAIYFTDDYRERMDEDYLYGGHDMGVFSLREGGGGVRPILDSEDQKIEPPPFWISLPSHFGFAVAEKQKLM